MNRHLREYSSMQSCSAAASHGGRMRDCGLLTRSTYVVDAIRPSLVELHPAGCLPPSSPLQCHFEGPCLQSLSAFSHTQHAQHALQLLCTSC